ncbi:MAG: hypothetical protein HY674_09215 [Chloroflexi bacterium]|nr:hypothetical protein [Chloroflexota bacterium]
MASARASGAKITRTGVAWLSFGVVCFLLATGVGGYGMLQVRHKREMLALGREIQRLESELGKALQQNQLLRSHLATQRAALAMRDSSKDNAKPVAHARTK